MVPLVDADGRYAGCISTRNRTEALNDPDPPPTVAARVEQPALITADTSTPEILSALPGYGGTGLPVLDAEQGIVIGWVNYETVLNRLHPGVAGDDQPKEGRDP